MSAPQRWRYHAADASGTISGGEIEAANMDDAMDLLRRRSLWVVDIEADRSGERDSTRADASSGAPAHRKDALRSGMQTGLRQIRHRLSVGDDETLAVLTRAAATLLQAGVPLERALTYAASGESSEVDERWRSVFIDLRDAVTRGESISGAALKAAALPRSFAPLLAAAEASGSLADTFARLAEDLERRSALRARVRAALVYPMILGAASIIGTLVILVVVVPRFADLIAGVGGTVPTSTRVLIASSGWLARFWWLLAGILVAGLATAKQALADPTRRLEWHASRLRLPVSGRFETEQAAAAYLGTLAIALESGVPLVRAMTLARGTVGNVAIQSRLARAEEAVRDGGSAAEALSGSLPAMATRLLQAGEQSGAMAALARRAAAAASEQVQRQITSAVALIEPVMILGFGAVVGLVALALLQAIYGLNAHNFS